MGLGIIIASYYLKARQQLYHGPALVRVLKEHGFQDVTGDYRSIPVCWGGYVGKIMYEVSSLWWNEKEQQDGVVKEKKKGADTLFRTR